MTEVGREGSPAGVAAGSAISSLSGTTFLTTELNLQFINLCTLHLSFLFDPDNHHVGVIVHILQLRK